jgi:uncharacterized RDD family membrane protein YckC
MTEPVQPQQQPPTGPQWTPPAGPSGPRASFFRRLGAFLIDIVIVGAAGGVVLGVLAAIDDSLLPLGYAFWLVASIAYAIYVTCGPSGQTVGKRILGIRVIDFGTGGSIGRGRAVIRYIGQIISSWICYLGFLWMLWDREKQTWADKMANSVVVPVEYYPVEQWP